MVILLLIGNIKESKIDTLWSDFSENKDNEKQNI